MHVVGVFVLRLFVRVFFVVFVITRYQYFLLYSVEVRK